MEIKYQYFKLFTFRRLLIFLSFFFIVIIIPVVVDAYGGPTIYCFSVGACGSRYCTPDTSCPDNRVGYTAYCKDTTGVRCPAGPVKNPSPCADIQITSCAYKVATCTVSKWCVGRVLHTRATNCNETTTTCSYCCGGTPAACYGECLAGRVLSVDCGKCGTRTNTCSSNCAWLGWTSCSGEGTCTAGSTQSVECGACGTRSRTCSSDCEWGSWGSCEDQGTCTAGATQSQRCTRCGTETRTCESDCTWSSWGICEDQGVCTINSTQTEPCGACGTRSRTCSTECAWGSWGSCYEGDCGGVPEVPTLVAPANSVWINYDPTYQATTTDPDNDQIRTFFNISGYGDNWGTWAASGGTSSWGPLNVGTCFQNWWRAYAQDIGGLESTYSGYWLAKVDKDLPTAAITYTTGTIYQLTFPVTLTESDACSGVKDGDVEVRSKLISAPVWPAYQDYAAAIDDFTYTGQSNYQYQFRYRARDNANNWSAYAEGGVTEIQFNNPPTAVPSSEVFIYCADARHPVLHFTYADPDGDLQGGYMIQVDNNVDFSSPEDNTGWHYTTSTQYTTNGSFDWNITYYWRVKVMDSKGLESSWSIADSFRTPLHAYPSPDFSYLPRSPSKEEAIRFTDNSSCFDDKPTTTECSPAYADAFSWDFDLNDDGLEGVVPLTSILENPIASYSNRGLWNVKLEVRDKDNYTCDIIKSIRITYPLPKWREVKPD